MSARSYVSRATLAAALSLALAAPLAGCLGRELKELNPCLVSAVNAQVQIDKIDKVDLLFMVDNSNSMKEEQVALSQQFKNIITVLTTGKRPGKRDFTPAKDLHLAVVSSDMGLSGFARVDNCEGTGDDGVMLNEPKLPGCKASFPRFLTYVANSSDPQVTANDFACIATLGTGGCGFEQQLESSLKALWPSGNKDITFVGDLVDGSRKLGHGDVENAGFLRTDPVQGLSVLAIVLVTDEEDCSVPDPIVLAPPDFLHLDDPFEAKLAKQGLNTRCALNPDKLFMTKRYVNGFKALRPGNEDLVIFAGIVGVPPETVDDTVLANTKFDDAASRAAFYRRILEHPAMQTAIDDRGTPDDSTDDVVRTSCQTTNGVAYPPRRIVEVAQGFGKNGIVQSICQNDFTPAINAIIDRITGLIGAVCLPRPLIRNSQGLVDCEVIWELPMPGKGPSNTPTSCADPSLSFLRPLPRKEWPFDHKGGELCRVPQLAVVGELGAQQAVPTVTGMETFAEGWFYDTFTPELLQQCGPLNQLQRIGYSAAANPPKGVNTRLSCLNETQRLASQRPDLSAGAQPAIGDPCADVERNGQRLSGDAACALTLANGQTDNHMFCHAEQTVCVQSCESSDQCPPAWVCDDRPESIADSGGRKYCVNPTCGDKQ